MAHTDCLFPHRCHWVGTFLRAMSVLVAREGSPRVSKFSASRHEEPRPKPHSCTAPAGPAVVCVRGSSSRPNLVVRIKISFSRSGIHFLVVQSIWNCSNSILGGTPLTHCNTYSPPSPPAVDNLISYPKHRRDTGWVDCIPRSKCIHHRSTCPLPFGWDLSHLCSFSAWALAAGNLSSPHSHPAKSNPNRTNSPSIQYGDDADGPSIIRH